MKLTIWQQFSSNNSSSYVIVGKFETAAKTVESAEKFKILLRKIWQWYQAHSDVREAVLNEEGHALTDAERAIMAEYSIEFTEAIEWVAREESEEFLADAVTTFENHLFVATVDETVTEDTPLAQYLHQLGADVLFEEKMRSYLVVEISATAPDEATAIYIKSSVDYYLMRDYNILWQRPPWVLFYDGKLAENLEVLSRDIDLFIANYHAWRQWHRDNREKYMELVRQRDDAWRRKDKKMGDKLQEEVATFLSGQGDVEPKLDEGLKQRLHKIMSGSSPLIDNNPEGVSLDNKFLKFPVLYFLSQNLGFGIPTIITWLRALGCVDVQYKFVAMPAY